jgi:hypothetical protein
LGKNIIVNDNDELIIGDNQSSLTVKNNSQENLIQTTGGLRIDPGKLKLVLPGLGPEKVLKSDSIGNAYWESEDSSVWVQYTGGDFIEDPNDENLRRVNINNSTITNKDQITSFSINGVEVSKDYYIVFEENNNYYLSLDISQNGVDFINEGGIEEDDLFFVSAT